MKLKFQHIFPLIVFLFFALGCSAINKIQKEVEKTQSPQVLTSTDGLYQITVPGTWQTESGLNAQATLQASNRIGELFVIIIRESKEDFGKKVDLNFVTEAIRDNLKKVLTDAVLSEPVSATVNGYPAQEFEATGEVQNIKLKYQYAVIETPQNYYQIITWTRSSRFDENLPQLMEIINSFKESGEIETPPSAAKPTGKSK